MRVISLKSLKAFWQRHPDAEAPLRAWHKCTAAAQWTNFVAVRQTFASADTAKVKSGNTVVVFDIAGNKFRLVAAIHYNTGCLYPLRVMTHAEYSRDRWKDQL
ncbi:MAG: type II toxin-antitoxin system HigB family toxin [Planctomycetota bacterium]|nr:type II toxin-antitoxin system HigB family toxin [Planctomycetota bacterium]